MTGKIVYGWDMTWLPTIDDCLTGAVYIHGVWYSRELANFQPNYCGCGCGVWCENCFFCKKPTLSFNAVMAAKNYTGTKYRFSCLECAVGREVVDVPCDKYFSIAGYV